MRFGAAARWLTIFSHDLAKARVLVFRGKHPYVKEGSGSCYNVACVDNTDIALYRAGGIMRADLLVRLTWKVGHSNDHEQRQWEYEKCDVGQTHIWVCRWEVDWHYSCGESAKLFFTCLKLKWCLSERLTQLQLLCDGGERFYKLCVCGVRHREYVTFPSIGGFAQFCLLTIGVLLFMNEPLNLFLYPCSPDTGDIYDLIIQS
jgi:hypothetical protein